MKIWILFIVFLSVSCAADLTKNEITGSLNFRIIPNNTEMVDGAYPEVLGIPGTTIVEVSPSINGKKIFISDENGYLSILDVPVGNYTIHPLFFDTTSDISLTVDEISESSIPVYLLPDLGTIYYYSINLTDTGNPSLTKEVRIAISKYLNREALLNNLNYDKTAAYDLIPYNHMYDGLMAIDSILEDTDWADTNIQNISDINFNILYNDSTMHLEVANTFISQITSMSQLGNITLTGQEWGTYLASRTNMNFEVARSGWGFDSNNMVDYFQTLVDESGYLNSEFDTLISHANSAITTGDLDSYVNNIIEIHDLLLSEMVIIPVYDY